MTVEELKEILSNNSYSLLISKIQYYAKNISGTNSYLYQVKEQLKATLTIPIIFWALSCDEFHWPEVHALARMKMRMIINMLSIFQMFWFGFSLKEHNHLLNIGFTMS